MIYLTRHGRKSENMTKLTVKLAECMTTYHAEFKISTFYVNESQLHSYFKYLTILT